MMRASCLTIGAAGVLFAATTAAGAGVKTASTWTAPDLQPGNYQKVAVLARFTDDVARRILEEEVVKGLKKRGIEAVAAYQVFTPEDLANDEAVEARAEALGVDAGLVFTVTGEDTQVKSSPGVHASVGVPVRAGPFSLFVGTSVPLGGGTSTITTIGLKSEFLTTGSEGPIWIATYTTDLKGGNEKTARKLASEALKQMKKADLFQ